MTQDELILGARGSMLSKAQVRLVESALRDAGLFKSIATEFIQTKGDVDARPIVELGSKGIFTADIEAALKRGAIHAAVHSLKDLPIDETKADGSEELTICAVLERAPVNDVLVSRFGQTLEALPHGARIGTSSTRRAAELLRRRPDLVAVPIRGNVDTRINKVLELGQFDATILAKAGLVRLGKEEHISETIPLDIMLSAPAQGAIAVQCLANYAHKAQLERVNHEPTALSVRAERAFLLGLGGGCSLPISAYAHLNASKLHLWTRVVESSGQAMIEQKQSVSVNESEGPKRLQKAHELGLRMAERAISLGAHKLMGL